MMLAWSVWYARNVLYFRTIYVIKLLSVVGIANTVVCMRCRDDHPPDQDFGDMEKIRNSCPFYGLKGLESPLSILVTRNLNWSLKSG